MARQSKLPFLYGGKKVDSIKLSAGEYAMAIGKTTGIFEGRVFILEDEEVQVELQHGVPKNVKYPAGVYRYETAKERSELDKLMSKNGYHQVAPNKCGLFREI